jgi:heme/copper-type cytochrome/quinol oxidase subunit 3
MEESMKKIIFGILAVVALGAVFSGCERNDYQHPLHRK